MGFSVPFFYILGEKKKEFTQEILIYLNRNRSKTLEESHTTNQRTHSYFLESHLCSYNLKMQTKTAYPQLSLGIC